MIISFKQFWMSGVWAKPPIVETIIAMTYPMLYLPKPVRAKVLKSKIEGATIIITRKDFPLDLIKKGKASMLKSKFQY